MKYSKLLELTAKSVQPDKENIRKQSTKAKIHPAIKAVSFITATVLLISILSVSAFYGIMNIPFNTKNEIPARLASISPLTSVTPTLATDKIIKTDTKFKVTTLKAISKKEFVNYFSISPKVDYTVTKQNGNSFIVSFKDDLNSNTKYKISSVLNDKTIYSWAFQTENSFSVIERYPSEQYINTTDPIEITFTHSNVENFDKYFSIFPSVPGTFEQYGRKWIFIPSTEFTANTLYTVTLNSDISVNGQALGSEYKFSFMARNAETYAYINYNENSISDTFSPNVIPTVTIEANNIDLSQANVSVFKINTADEFINLQKNYVYKAGVSSAIETELPNHEQVTAFTATAQNINGRNYITYPNTYTTGYYISKIEFSNIVLYHIFQVNELSVYTLSSNGKYTIWVNNSVTGQPLVNAKVDIKNIGIQTTDGNGITQFEITENNNLDDIYYTIQTDVSAAFAGHIFTSAKSSYNDYLTDYNSCIILDSSNYSAGDSVKVCGFTRYRGNIARISEKVTLFTSWDNNTVSVDLSDSCIFSAEFELPEYLPGTSYYVALMNDDNIICKSDFSVNSDRAEITLYVTPSTKACYRTEEINYTVKAIYNNGTPASNIPINVNDTTIITDDSGIASYMTFAKYDKAGISNSKPSKFATVFTAIDPNGKTVTKECSVAVFDTDLVIFANESISDTQNIEISLRSIKPELLNESSLSEVYLASQVLDSNAYIDTVYDADLTVELHKISYEREAVSTIHNPTKNINDRIYKYTEIDELVSTQTVTTNNGYALLQKPNTELNEKYYYRIYTEGRVYGTAFINYYPVSCSNLEQSAADYSLTTSSDSFTTNGSINAILTKKSTSESVDSGRLLISIIEDSRQENFSFAANEQIKIDFNDITSSQITLKSVYFDGEELKEVDDIILNRQSNNINIDIKTEEKIYMSGENVNVDIIVTDQTDTMIDAELCIKVTQQNSDLFSSTNFINSPKIDNIQTISSPTPNHNYTDTINVANEERTENFNTEKAIYFVNTTAVLGKATIAFTLPEIIGKCEISVFGIDDKTNFGCSQINFMVNGKTPQTVDTNEYSQSLIKTALDGETVLNKNDFDSDITAHIYDEEYDIYYSVINHLASLENATLEHKLARALAESFLSGTAFGKIKSEYDFKDYINAEDSVLFKNTDYTSLELSVKTTAVAFECFDINLQKQYYYQILDDNPNTLKTICALFGLSALGEPTLNDLDVIRQNLSSLSDEEILYLILAYSYAGDLKTAEQLFNENISSKLKTTNDITVLEGQTVHDTSNLTALCSLAASSISLEQSKPLMKSILNDNSKSQIYTAELIAFVKQCIPSLKGKNKITIILNEKTEIDVTYPRAISVSIPIKNHNISKTQFKNDSGNTVITAFGYKKSSL